MSKQKLSKSKPEINPGSKLRVLAVTPTISKKNQFTMYFSLTFNQCFCTFKRFLSNLDFYLKDTYSQKFFSFLYKFKF